jgi:hypothetical protein
LTGAGIAPYGFRADCNTAQYTPKIQYVMSILKYGKPMVKPKDNKVDEDKDKMDDTRTHPDDVHVAMAFVKDAEKMIETDYPEDTAKFAVYLDSMSLLFENIMELFMTDTFRAVFSMLFVWGFITYHTQSCMLSSLGMGVILLSYPATAFITSVIFQVKYFGFL